MVYVEVRSSLAWEMRKERIRRVITGWFCTGFPRRDCVKCVRIVDGSKSDGIFEFVPFYWELFKILYLLSEEYRYQVLN